MHPLVLSVTPSMGREDITSHVIKSPNPLAIGWLKSLIFVYADVGMGFVSYEAYYDIGTFQEYPIKSISSIVPPSGPNFISNSWIILLYLYWGRPVSIDRCL